MKKSVITQKMINDAFEFEDSFLNEESESKEFVKNNSRVWVNKILEESPKEYLEVLMYQNEFLRIELQTTLDNAKKMQSIKMEKWLKDMFSSMYLKKIDSLARRIKKYNYKIRKLENPEYPIFRKLNAEEIKSSINIIDVIGGYVSIDKYGHAKCPFHSDGDPSFHVYEKTQTAKCFGCGWFGDVFSFIMEIEGITFIEALKRLG